VDGEAGSGLIKLKTNDNEEKEYSTQIIHDKDVTQQFACKYLNMFNKASTLSNTVRLCLRNDNPLVVEFNIHKVGVIKFFLAPKIADDSWRNGEIEDNTDRRFSKWKESSAISKNIYQPWSKVYFLTLGIFLRNKP